MELGDLRVALGLSSYGSDLRGNGIGSFESMQGMELFECCKRDGFCVLKPYLGF